MFSQGLRYLRLPSNSLLAEKDLEFLISCLYLPECWDYRSMPLCGAASFPIQIEDKNGGRS